MNLSATRLIVPQSIMVRLLARSLGYWVLVRAFLYFFWGGTLFHELPFAISVTVAATIAVRTDMHFTREEAFLDNLGISLRAMLIMSAASILALEIAAFVLTHIKGW